MALSIACSLFTRTWAGTLATHSVPGPGLGTGVLPEAQDGYCHTSSLCVHRGESLPNGWGRMGVGSRTIENKSLKRGRRVCK